MSTESVSDEVESEEEASKTFSYFDYRVMLTDTGEYEIRDVYYDADGEINGWGSQANAHVGTDLEDLAAGIGYAVRAMARPLLVESELSGYLAPEDGPTAPESASGEPGELSAVVTAGYVPATLGDAERWAVSLMGRFGIGDDTELLDGAQLHPEGFPSLVEHVGNVPRSGYITVGDLRAWIAHLYTQGLDAATVLLESQDLAVDLPVVGVREVAWGNGEFFDVVVEVREHDEDLGS